MLASFLAATSLVEGLLMEMSNTISNPSDWVQYYHRTLSGQGVGQAPSMSDATVVTTTAPSVAVASNSSLNPEGRVTKPARRRRASRAAPTTLVNTDTSNFRAMVQQFTGVSNPTLTFGNDGQNIDFRTFQNPVPQGTGFRNPFQRHHHHRVVQQQQQIVVQQQQQQQQGYMQQLQNRGDGFISSFSNTRPNVEASSDGFLGGNTSSSSQMFPRSSSSAINNRNNGYIQ